MRPAGDSRFPRDAGTPPCASPWNTDGCHPLRRRARRPRIFLKSFPTAPGAHGLGTSFFFRHKHINIFCPYSKFLERITIYIRTHSRGLLNKFNYIISPVKSNKRAFAGDRISMIFWRPVENNIAILFKRNTPLACFAFIDEGNRKYMAPPWL